MDRKTPNCQMCLWSYTNWFETTIKCGACGGQNAAIVHNSDKCKDLYKEQIKVKEKEND